ncbi:GTPase Obg [archaeon HR01]|nr:GTPase Obg [archaeon HR01]
MPTNLTAEAQAKLAKYTQARTLEEKIRALEEALPLIPDHKGTERMRAQLKTTLAKLRREAERRKSVKVGRHDEFSVRREGDVQVSLLGVANSGKSTLLSSLTNAKPAIAPYSLTTVRPIPGMTQHMDVEIQLVELPAILTDGLEETSFTGRSIAFARNSDLIAIMLDCANNPLQQLEKIIQLLDEGGITLRRREAIVVVEKKDSGGIRLVSFGHFRASLQEVRSLLESVGVKNAVVKVYGDAGLEELEEQLLRETVYKPSVVVGGRADLADAGELERLRRRVEELGRPLVLFSVRDRASITHLRDILYQNLNIIRIYTQKDGVITRKPVVLGVGSTVQELARVIHKDFAERLRYARVWGRSVRIQGQQVGPGHRLEDGDVVELFL